MNTNLWLEAKRVCGEIEAGFSDVYADFEGFIAPYLGGERDGFIMVEIINVSEGNSQSVLEFAESLARGVFARHQALLSFGVWEKPETGLHFQRDLVRLRNDRRRWLHTEQQGKQSENQWSNPSHPFRRLAPDAQKMEKAA